MDYSKKTDEQLIELYRSGDQGASDFLLDRYKGMARKYSKHYYLVGGESDDLLQEGMIGLFKAIEGYRQDSGTLFSTFAALCIRRQMVKAIDSSNTHKNEPLNSYISISHGQDEDGEDQEALYGAGGNPEDIYIEAEGRRDLLAQLRSRLSPMELQVYDLLMEDMDYQEIARALDKSPKSIDNTITRIRQKAQHLSD